MRRSILLSSAIDILQGGWITRTYGRPADGIHAVQMELAMRAYLRDEGDAPTWDADFAKPIQQTLRTVLQACLYYALP